jgi:hypothetical protein
VNPKKSPRRLRVSPKRLAGLGVMAHSPTVARRPGTAGSASPTREPNPAAPGLPSPTRRHQDQPTAGPAGQPHSDRV